MLNVAVVGEIYRALQPRGDVALPRRAVAAIVNHYGVELLAGQEAACVEKLPAAGGAEVEGLRRAQRLQALVHQPPAELGDLYGVCHGAEDARHGPASHVAAEAGSQAHVEEAAHRGYAARNVHIGRRAVRYIHSPLAYELKFLLLREHTVGHDRRPALAAEKAEAVIGIAVEGALRAEGAHELDLSHVLGEVRLQGESALAPYPAQGAQQRIRARGYESWRQHRRRALIASLGGLQPVQHGRDGTLRIPLAQPIRGVPVHAHLAHHGNKAARLQLVHEQQRGLGVCRCEHACAGVRAAANILHEAAVGPVRVLEVRKAALLREGVGIEPVKQLDVHAGAAVGELRGVDVQVNKSGQNELSRAVYDRQTRPTLGQLAENTGGVPVLTDEEGSAGTFQLTRGKAVADVALYDKAVFRHRV